MMRIDPTQGQTFSKKALKIIRKIGFYNTIDITIYIKEQITTSKNFYELEAYTKFILSYLPNELQNNQPW